MSLADRLKKSPAVLAPGCYDALSAALIEQAGFEAAYVSGGSIAYTQLGRPDIGLVSFTEVADVVGRIRERVEIPVVVDIDTGFGNALNVQRAIRLFAQRGADAVQLEDQTMPKRCGHLQEKRLVPTAEMVGKVKAALDARPGPEPLVIARTDAIAVEGFSAAIDRAGAYLDAGADMLFVEAPRTDDELAAIGRTFAGKVPLMANMVEGGATPIRDAAQLEKLGFAFVIFPGGLVRAFARMATEYLASLKRHGTTTPFRDRMHDFKSLQSLLGTDEMLERGKRYDRG